MISSTRLCVRVILINLSGFNLVIEVLLISSLAGQGLSTQEILAKFQSRNRGSFDFKQTFTQPISNPDLPFQSRNRGSFDFKAPNYAVIEMHDLDVSIS